MIINLRLPWPPSGNRYWRNVLGRMIVSKEARAYKETVKKLVMAHRLHTLSGKIELSIHAYPPDRRKRDLDNLLKVVIDAMQDAGLYANDSQIDKISIQRMSIDGDGGELVIELKELL
jgi:crossover junction endodeoxyribonuclease RusA